MTDTRPDVPASLPARLTIDTFCELAPRLKIYNKRGDEIRFIPNKAQFAILEAAKSQEDAGLPIRLRILKPRQFGVSLLCNFWALFRTLRTGGHQALSIADKLLLPTLWLRRCRNWVEQMQKTFKIPIELGASNANELWFTESNSRYYIASAEGQTPGMGETIQTVHCSEIASWADPDKVLFDLLPAVPPGPHTAIIQESTGRIVGDWWYQRYQEAKAGEDGYKAVFLPWYILEEYCDKDAPRGALTPYEEGLRTQGVSDGQLAWRRRTVRDIFHGDEAAFANQYPATEDEAFLAAGREVFTTEEVAQARQTVRVPVWRGDIIPAGNPSEYHVFASEGGRLLIWEHPLAKRHYAIGADCQWGPREASDYDAAYVECVETGKVVARWWGRESMGEWAKTLAALGFYYNKALLSPERNTLAAQGVILPLLGLAGNTWRYPNLYVRTGLRAYGARKPEDYGWLTDQHTKPQMVMLVHQRMSTGAMDWPDEGAVAEMASYVVDENSKMTAPPGQHDDRLMARMIASAVAGEYRAFLASEPPEPAAGTGGIMRSLEERVREMILADEPDEAAEVPR